MPKERRIPTQPRSREKYDQLLESAKELIGQKGNDAVSMREISKHSGVALASIYQYFPDKNAILQAIMEGYFGQIRAIIISSIEECKSINELRKKIDGGVDIFYLMFKNEPVLATLWAGLQANTKLRELDANDSLVNAELIANKICSIMGDDNKQKFFDSLVLLLNMAGVAVRLAITLPEPQGDRLIAEFKQIALLRLNSFVQPE